MASKYVVDGQPRDFDGVIVSVRASVAGSSCADAVMAVPTTLYTVRFEDGEDVEMKRNNFELLDDKLLSAAAASSSEM